MGSPLATIACCAPLGAPTLSETEVESAAELFRVLGDPARVKIVNMLATSDEPVCICHLTEPLALSQPTVSHHMKRLVDAGLLVRAQRGRWAYYSLEESAAERLAALADLTGGMT